MEGLSNGVTNQEESLSESREERTRACGFWNASCLDCSTKQMFCIDRAST